MGQTVSMSRLSAVIQHSPVGRHVRGISRRLRDAGLLLRSGQAPERRTRDNLGGSSDVPPFFCGWTRYSAFRPGSKAFVASRNSEDDETYKASLWSAARLGPREQIFLGLSLPLLQQMATRHAYTHFLTYSPEMPDPWQKHLQDAVRSHSVLHLHPVHRGLRFVIREHLIAQDSPSRTVVLFRVDDDDLLALDYLDVLANYATPHDHGRAVSLARGYSAMWHEGRVSQIRHTYRRLGSQGQANVGTWDAATQTLDLPAAGSHASVDRRMPTILDSRRPAFLQLRHLGQDTAMPEKGMDHLRATGASAAPLSQDELDAALAAFPTLHSVLHSEETEIAEPPEHPRQDEG